MSEQIGRAGALAVNKRTILDLILTTLKSELEALTRGARASFAAATDPDSKAENKYDTRTLEASYVARGQAQRVAELEAAVSAFRALSDKAAPPDAPVFMGSLLTLQMEGASEHYFMGPAAGGTEVHDGENEILVITPASPLGQKLLGKRSGDRVEMRPGSFAQITTVT